MREKLQRKPTQKQKILNYIRQFGSITSWQAYQDLGITQLGARIWGVKGRWLQIYYNKGIYKKPFRRKNTL